MSELDVFILRHGDANSGSKMMTDSKRPLSDAGVKEAEAVARLFAGLEIKFSTIFTSPLLRTRQTADLILKFQKKAKIVELDELKPEGKEGQIAATLGKQNNDILVVGHNPLLVNLINHIIGATDAQSLIALKTGGLAKISISSKQPRLKGELEWLLTPKVIRKISK